MASNSRPYISLNFRQLSSRISVDELNAVMEAEYQEAEKRRRSAEEAARAFEESLKGQATQDEQAAKELRALKIEQNKISLRHKQLQKRNEEFAALSPEEKELYTQLYSIKQALDGEVVKNERGATPEEREEEINRAECRIVRDENGLHLAIEDYKPGNLAFSISDGKLEFSPEGMTPDKMREMFDFLDRRGFGSMLDWKILNAKPPYTLENADDKLQEVFDQAVEQIRNEEPENGAEEEIHTLTSENEPEEQQNAENTAQTQEASNGTSGGNQPTLEDLDSPQITKSPKKPDPKKQSGLDKAVAAMTKWANKNKRRDLTYFQTHEGGYTVFTFFEKENSNNLEWDGLIDKKTGEVKSKHECKVYLRSTPDGNTEVAFSLPAGKNLNDGYAELLMDTLKESGATRVRFGSGLSDSSEGVLRVACGLKLMVPVGHKLTETRVAKIIKAAEGKHGENNPKVFKYKRDLALQMASYIKEKTGHDFRDYPNDADCRCCRHLIGNYTYYPFRDLWEDYGLCDKLKEAISANDHASGKPDGAVEIIGAAKAAGRLFDIYKSHCGASIYEDISIGDVIEKCDSRMMNDAEKAEFSSYLAQIGVSKDVPMHDLNQSATPSPMLKLYEILSKRCKEEAAKDLDAEFIKNSKVQVSAGESKDNITIRSQMTIATSCLQSIRDELNDVGLKPIFLPNLGRPDYGFEAAKRQVEASRPQQPRTSAPRRGYNAGYRNGGSSYV